MEIFLDKNTKYSFLIRLLENNDNLKNDIKMHEKYIKDYKEQTKKKANNDSPIKFYKTKKGIVKFKSKS